MAIARVSSTAGKLLLSSKEVSGLTALVDRFNRTVPLSLFRVWLTSPDTHTFTYRFTATDGRLWQQTLRFDTDADPKMTFSVPDGWRASEFSIHREIRDIVVRLISKHGLIEYRWDA